MTAQADIAGALGSDMETTLHGDLPEGFWGESAEQGGSLDEAATSSADDSAASRLADDGSEVGDPGGGDDAVPLFGSRSGGARLPLPTTAAAQGAAPQAPESERFEQLQALFPGRIIEVTRRVQEPAAEVATVGGHGDPVAGDFGAPEDYAGTLATESADEPRYDTAAEAAAEESL